MKWILVFFMLIASRFGAVTSPAAAEAQVEGRVRLPSGQPAVGAQVWLFDLADLHAAPRTATTDAAGHFALSLEVLLARPKRFDLGPNYPNPFNSSTIIPYSLPMATTVRLEIFNVLGQKVTTLVDEAKQAGFYTARWDGTDAGGGAVAAGVYFYRLHGAERTLTGRMVLVDGQAGVPAAALAGAKVGGVDGESAVASASGDGQAVPVYGLTVSGGGLIPYIDPTFRVEAGMTPLDLVVEAGSSAPRAKATTQGRLLGDVDNNGRVNMNDALLVAMYSANSVFFVPNGGDIALGDVNQDGHVASTDAQFIATYTNDPSSSILPAGIGAPLGPDADVAEWQIIMVLQGGLSGRSYQSLSFFPDGSTLASVRERIGYDVVSAELWDVATGQQKAFFFYDKSSRVMPSFSPDGSLLATSDDKTVVRLWDVATGQQKAALEGHKDDIRSLSFSPDGSTLAVNRIWRVRLWDVATGQLKASFRDSYEISSVLFSPDGSLLATGSRLDNTVHLWDVATPKWKWRATLDGRSSGEEGPRWVLFSPDGSLLATGSHNGTVQLWDVATGQQKAALEGHSSALSFSPDGSTLASSIRNGSRVQLWDVATGQVKAALGHTDRVYSLSFSPDGSLLATSEDKAVVRLWDVATGQQKAALGHTSGVSALSFSPDGSLLATGSHDGTVRLWGRGVQLSRPDTDLLLQDYMDINEVSSLSFSPDGSLVASGSADNTVRLWDAATGQMQAILSGHMSSVTMVSFSPDGSLVASGSENGTVWLWNAATGQVRTTLRHENENDVEHVDLLSFSPDGSTLASSIRNDSRVWLWDVATGQVKATVRGHTRGVSSVSFSPDGSTLAGGRGGGVKLWDVATGQVKASFGVDAKTIFSVSFSPDGSLVASGSADGTIRLWDVATGQVKASFGGHTDAVGLLSFSPDGSTLASSIRNDSRVWLWDVATGQGRAIPSTGLVTMVSFSPDGSLLATGNDDNTVGLWDVATGQVKAGFLTSGVWSLSFSLEAV